MIKYIQLTKACRYFPSKTSMVKRAKEWVLYGKFCDFYASNKDIVFLSVTDNTEEQLLSMFPKKYNVTRSCITAPRRAMVLK